MATFESLPEELHYEIFKLHFSQNLKVVIHSAPGLSEPVQHSAAILLVSHRIYDRAISVFQDLVVFDVQDTWLCPRLFFRSPIWSANHSAIRNLRVDCLPRLPGDNWTNLFENTIELEPVYQAVPYNDLPNLKKVCLHNRNEYDQLQPENPRRMRIRRSLRNKIFQHIKDDPILASMKTILNVNDREWSIEIIVYTNRLTCTSQEIESCRITEFDLENITANKNDFPAREVEKPQEHRARSIAVTWDEGLQNR